MSDQPTIYLDWAATAPLSAAVYEAMQPYLMPGVEGIDAGNANANSLHSAGRDAFKALEAARRGVAKAIEARPDEIIFTSGATEADNAALIGIVEGVLRKRNKTFANAVKEGEARPTVVVSAIEHDAVLRAADALKRYGIEVVYVAPNAAGFVTKEALQKALDSAEDPILVSVMAVNNETGAVMDIEALSETAHQAGALFHCDATQALGKIPLSVKRWGVDALSLSSHKISGPKGVGALYLKSRTPFLPQLVGGGQEMNRRSGTQNIAGAVGFAAAITEATDNLVDNAKHMEAVRDRLLEELSVLKGVTLVTDPSKGLYAPHIVAIMCAGFESETLILQMDKRGVCVSGGSACSSRSLDPSHVLTAMGIARDEALGSLRFSFGPITEQEEIDYAIEMLQEVLETTWN